MKENTNWNENRINNHIKKLLIEEKDGIGISAKRVYHSAYAILFNSRK